MMKYLFYDWLGFNQTLFEQLNYILNLGFRPYIFYAISQPFQILAFPSYYLFFLVYKYFLLKKVKFEYQIFIREFKLAFRIGITYFCIALAYTIMKYNINMPRPYCSSANFVSIINFTDVRCLSSFPSAHTAMAFMICYFLLPYLNLTSKILAYILVIAAGLSRIALAMHYPADVAYSIIIAYIICASIDKILKRDFIYNRITVPTAHLCFQIVKRIN